MRDIEGNAGVPLAGRELLLLGAGGAAAGVLGPLLAAGCRRVVVANRTLDRAVTLVQRHAALALGHGATLEAQPLQAMPGRFDVVVNATAASLAGDAVALAPEVLRPGALAIDLMYGPAAAGFMAWARAHGATPRDGLGMLVEQAAEAFEIWRGVRPPAQQVLAELRAIVDAGMKALRVPGWPAWRWRRSACNCSSSGASRLMAWIDPQSTTFQRSEAWLIATQGRGNGKRDWQQAGCRTTGSPTASSAP